MVDFPFPTFTHPLQMAPDTLNNYGRTGGLLRVWLASLLERQRHSTQHLTRTLATRGRTAALFNGVGLEEVRKEGGCRWHAWSVGAGLSEAQRLRCSANAKPEIWNPACDAFTIVPSVANGGMGG